MTNFGTKVDTATRSYDNGIYCNNSKCWVNWGEAKEILQELLLVAGLLAWQVWDINILL